MAKAKQTDTEEPTAEGPEASHQKSADTLEEALAMQDAITKENAEAIAAEGQATAEETAAAYEEERAEAEDALMERDDEVYGRTVPTEAEATGTSTTNAAEAAAEKA